MSNPELPSHEAAHSQPEKLHQQEWQVAIDGFKQEEINLSGQVEANWENVPVAAKDWLINPENCPAEYLDSTRQVFLDYAAVDASLAELTAGDLHEFMNFCLTEASEIAELDEEIEELDTTIDVLSTIDAFVTEKNLKGQAALDFAYQYINEPEIDIPESVREEVIARLEDIKVAVGEMIAITDDPAEQAAIAQIVDNSALNLSGENRRAVFADMVAQIDASEDISEATKTKIKAEVIGVEGLDNATDTLNTLREIRANDGKFRDAHGKLVQFSEEYGVEIDRYTIFPDPNNSNGYVAKLEVGGRTLRFPFAADTDPGYFNDLATSIAVASVFANRDLQAPTKHILGHDGFASQGYREIRLDEEQVQRAKRLYGAFMGFGVELETKFPSPSDLNTFERSLQNTHPDGDLNTGDNTGRGDKGWTQIGMFKNGKLNLERVEEVGAFIRKNYSSLPSFEQLVERFGEDELYQQ